MNNLGRILKCCRKFNRMTQEEVAQKINLSRSYISEIEKGVKVPTIETLQRFSKIFGVEVSALLLFAEKWEERKSLKTKIKKILCENALKLLEFISK